jgi:hypothetical protein
VRDPMIKTPVAMLTLTEIKTELKSYVARTADQVINDEQHKERRAQLWAKLDKTLRDWRPNSNGR